MSSLRPLLTLLVFSLTVAPALVETASGRPNILVCVADDASHKSFEAYGDTFIATPAIDKLAREGVVFQNAYNGNPKCAPARACLVTGMFSWQLKEAANHWPAFPAEYAFYPHILMEKGYHVGFTGKGWGPGLYTTQYNPAGPDYNSLKLKPPYTGISNINYAGNFGAFLSEVEDGQPFCFWLGTKEPHRVYEEGSWKTARRNLQDAVLPGFYPDNAVIRGDLLDYALEVEWYDRHVGLAVRLLEEKGLLDNTIIIVTSDHGMPFPRVKGQVYEEGVHVPFIVYWKGKVAPGRVVSDFISFGDVAPTLMQAGGYALHPQMTGKSFLPQLMSPDSGRIDSARDHTLLGKERHDIGRTDGAQLSVGYPARAIRTDKFLYVRNFKPDRWPGGDPQYGLLNCDASPTKAFLTGLSMGDPDYRFYELSFGKRPSEELYDISEDPDCVRNLASDPAFATIKTQLWIQLRDELAQQGDPRIVADGDIFDYYPNARVDRQQQLYNKPDYDPVRLFEEKYGDPAPK